MHCTLFYILFFFVSLSSLQSIAAATTTLRNLTIPSFDYYVTITEDPKNVPSALKKTIFISGASKEFSFQLNLELNTNLFAKDYFFYGPSLRWRDNSLPQKNCYYHGNVERYPKSFVAISNCDGYHGMIILDEDIQKFSIHTLPDRTKFVLREETTFSPQNNYYYETPSSVPGLDPLSSFYPQQPSNQVYSQRSPINTVSSFPSTFFNFYRGPLQSPSSWLPWLSNVFNFFRQPFRRYPVSRMMKETVPFVFRSSSQNLDMYYFPKKTSDGSLRTRLNQWNTKEPRILNPSFYLTQRTQLNLTKRNAFSKDPIRQGHGITQYYKVFIGLNLDRVLSEWNHGEHLIGDYMNLAQYYYQRHSFHGYQIQLSGAHVLGKGVIPFMNYVGEEEPFLEKWRAHGSKYGLLRHSEMGYLITVDHRDLSFVQSNKHAKYTAGLGYVNDRYCFKYRSYSFGVIHQTRPHDLYEHISTLVHELGHNTGINHHGTYNTCQNDGSTMGSDLGEPWKWKPFSACSLQQTKCFPGSFRKFEMNIN